MVKKILIGFVLAAFISSAFGGYSSGGRSGFSGGSRSFSSARSNSYSSVGRSGYSRSTNTTRAYVAPRSYSGYSSNTVIHNNHYSHGGYGGGFGGGFFSGMLGGYIGGSLANNNHTTVVAGAAPVMGEGQGMLLEQRGYVDSGRGVFGSLIGAIFSLFMIFLLFAIGVVIYRAWFNNHNCRNRW